MQGTRISEKTYELIKQMLLQGYSAKKLSQMLPAEISVSLNTIRKIDGAATYNEYCGVKPEPKAPEKPVQIVPYTSSREIVDAINATNEKLDRLCGMLASLLESLA